jgi:hypothetical protein
MTEKATTTGVFRRYRGLLPLGEKSRARPGLLDMRNMLALLIALVVGFELPSLWSISQLASSSVPTDLAQTSSALESGDVARAKDIVDEYWSSDPQRRYSLLSRNYRQQLQRSRRIANAQQYARATSEPERIWRERIYQEARQTGPDFVQIKVLVGWEQEGYEGVMTFIFELVREQGTWKIEAIMR